jgi:hypothetical protein
MEFADRLVRRRRLPGEVMHRSFSIYNQCRECRGWESDGGMELHALVEACRETTCPLWTNRSKKASQKIIRRGIESGGISPYPQPLKCLPVVFYGPKLATALYSERGFTRGEAIKEFCRMCRCVELGDRGVISACDTEECHLHPWRNGKLEE